MSGTLRSLQTTVKGAVKRLSADLYSGEALLGQSREVVLQL